MYFCFKISVVTAHFRKFAPRAWLSRENAFQKQEVKGRKGGRYYKSIGLGYKTPKDAIFGSYIDKKCPFTGNMNRTIVIRRDYLKICQCTSPHVSGDIVTVGECRPLSKTVSFNVIKVSKAAGSKYKKSFNKF
ncbi:unnamed protein product [Trichobilharzia szidati]|nr:unnamed protein product [Trichobilharzia szidati]